MIDKIKNIVQIVAFSLCLFTISAFCFLKAPKSESESERRPLKQMPEISVQSITSGKFMKDFESYTLDQFPLRDYFRRLKAYSSFYLFSQKDNNGLYFSDGYISKMEYPLNEESIKKASKKFRFIYEKYLLTSNSKAYISVINDKNAFMAEKTGHLYFDYNKFGEMIKSQNDFASFIDISSLLSLEDFYKTDTHWRQENIVDIADKLASSMGATIDKDYTLNLLEKDFYGVYHGQLSLTDAPDSLYYLTNETIDYLKVYDIQNQKEMGVYDFSKGYGKDPYEIFLSGSLSLITIDNPLAKIDKELVVFRDSFGSSIIPLIATGYKNVTVIDIRYISSSVLSDFVDFTNKDVLFLYSSMVLNNSNTLK